MSDPYQVLRLPPDAGADDVERAYRKLARRYPPELAPQRFAEIHRAYKQLTSVGQSLQQAFENPFETLEQLFPPPDARLRPPGEAPARPAAEDYEPLLHGLRRQLLRLVLARLPRGG